MADRRRRRIVGSISDADESESEQPGVNSELSPRVRESECESECGLEDSEYESATEDNEEYDSDEETETGSETCSDETEGQLTDFTEEERQNGDGEEEPEKAPEQDDDKSHPAFIPRKGAFYEHDSREDNSTADQKTTPDTSKQKKLWHDATRWDHDRYNPDLQAPKSSEELIAEYGYDIRAKDKPPDAPPLRRGGNRRGMSRLSDFVPDTRRYNQSRRDDNYQSNNIRNTSPRNHSDYHQGGIRSGFDRRGGYSDRGRYYSEKGQRSYTERDNNQPDRSRSFSDQGGRSSFEERGGRSNNDNRDWNRSGFQRGGGPGSGRGGGRSFNERASRGKGDGFHGRNRNVSEPEEPFPQLSSTEKSKTADENRDSLSDWEDEPRSAPPPTTNYRYDKQSGYISNKEPPLLSKPSVEPPSEQPEQNRNSSRSSPPSDQVHQSSKDTTSNQQQRPPRFESQDTRYHTTGSASNDYANNDYTASKTRSNTYNSQQTEYSNRRPYDRDNQHYRDNRYDNRQRQGGDNYGHNNSRRRGASNTGGGPQGGHRPKPRYDRPPRFINKEDSPDVLPPEVPQVTALVTRGTASAPGMSQAGVGAGAGGDKSYSRGRHIKSAGRSHRPEQHASDSTPPVNDPTSMIYPPTTTVVTSTYNKPPATGTGDRGATGSVGGIGDTAQSKSTKRYSSQRQRNAPDALYTEDHDMNQAPSSIVPVQQPGPPPGPPHVSSGPHPQMQVGVPLPAQHPPPTTLVMAPSTVHIPVQAPPQGQILIDKYNSVMLQQGNNLPLMVNFNTPPPQGSAPGTSPGPTVYQLPQLPPPNVTPVPPHAVPSAAVPPAMIAAAAAGQPPPQLHGDQGAVQAGSGSQGDSQQHHVSGGTTYYNTDLQPTSGSAAPPPPKHGTTYYNPNLQQRPAGAPTAKKTDGAVYFNPDLQPTAKKTDGAVYFNPDLQLVHSPTRSPVRRQKSAIPIVDPQSYDQSGSEGEQTQDPNAVDKQDYDSHHSCDDTNNLPKNTVGEAHMQQQREEHMQQQGEEHMQQEREEHMQQQGEEHMQQQGKEHMQQEREEHMQQGEKHMQETDQGAQPSNPQNEEMEPSEANGTSDAAHDDTMQPDTSASSADKGIGENITAGDNVDAAMSDKAALQEDSIPKEHSDIDTARNGMDDAKNSIKCDEAVTLSSEAVCKALPGKEDVGNIINPVDAMTCKTAELSLNPTATDGETVDHDCVNVGDGEDSAAANQ